VRGYGLSQAEGKEAGNAFHFIISRGAAMPGFFDKEFLGALSVAIALVAYGIYGWQTARGEIRPHPLSWLIFGTLTATGYWIQRDQGAGAGSWVMGATAVICFVLCIASFAMGERKYSRRDWAFLFAAALVFLFYVGTREPTVSAILATVVDVLGYGPTINKANERPYSDSVTSFALNSVKFIPSLFAMDSFSIATMIYPSTLIVVNAAVAGLLLWRRREGSGSIAG
jgi:Ca2+/Na+ antiporter